MLLSICIPTYDRSDHLRRTLDSIVSQSAWENGETEVVVSDNCSNDGTWEVISEFSEKFPERIRGMRQRECIHAHDNFEAALRMGAGDFLKLNNDTLVWHDGALAEYLALIGEASRIGTDLILTPNSRLAPVYGRRMVECPTPDDVLRQCSYFLTWIGSICFRKTAFLALPEPSRRKDTSLTQTDMVLRLASGGAGVVADGRIFFDSIPVKNKSPKSLIEVFSVNFPDMIRAYVPGKISSKTFAAMKKKLFREFVIPSYFDFFRENPDMKRPGYWKATVRYHREWYFYSGFLRIAALYVLSRCFSRETLRRLKRLLTGGGGI